VGVHILDSLSSKESQFLLPFFFVLVPVFILQLLNLFVFSSRDYRGLIIRLLWSFLFFLLFLFFRWGLLLAFSDFGVFLQLNFFIFFSLKCFLLISLVSFNLLLCFHELLIFTELDHLEFCVFSSLYVLGVLGHHSRLCESGHLGHLTSSIIYFTFFCLIVNVLLRWIHLVIFEFLHLFLKV
jgi:hypothetical protein